MVTNAAASVRARISIGEVLELLRPDFPGLNISKIRYLESEGLVEPERTSAGYRKFSHHDVDRLRYVLSAQRERVSCRWCGATDQIEEVPRDA